MKKSAFPYLEIDHTESSIQNKTIYYDQDTGISQRLYIATKIVAGIASNSNLNTDNKHVCKIALSLADELIRQDEEE